VGSRPKKKKKDKGTGWAPASIRRRKKKNRGNIGGGGWEGERKEVNHLLGLPRKSCSVHGDRDQPNHRIKVGGVATSAKVSEGGGEKRGVVCSQQLRIIGEAPEGRARRAEKLLPKTKLKGESGIKNRTGRRKGRNSTSQKGVRKYSVSEL